MYESYPIAIQPPAERLESFGALVDRGLSPETVVADFGISTRCHSLFENDAMTIGRYFRTLRLQGCRPALERGHAPGCSFTELALSWGFYDLSHMRRAFRAEFGLTPSNVRLQAAEHFRGD